MSLKAHSLLPHLARPAKDIHEVRGDDLDDVLLHLWSQEGEVI